MGPRYNWHTKYYTHWNSEVDVFCLAMETATFYKGLVVWNRKQVLTSSLSNLKVSFDEGERNVDLSPLSPTLDGLLTVDAAVNLTIFTNTAYLQLAMVVAGDRICSSFVVLGQHKVWLALKSCPFFSSEDEDYFMFFTFFFTVNKETSYRWGNRQQFQAQRKTSFTELFEEDRTGYTKNTNKCLHIQSHRHVKPYLNRPTVCE